MVNIIGVQSPIFDKYSTLSSLHYVKKLGGNAIQIYVGDKIKTTLTDKEKLNNESIKNIKDFMKKNKIHIYIHSIVRLNFCYPVGPKKFEWGLTNLIYDMNFASKIGAKYCIIHLGIRNNKYENLTEEECIKNYIKSVLYVLKKTPNNTKIMIELCANEKNKIAGSLERFGKLFNKFTSLQKKRIGVCIDTQHIFAAGYPINTVDGVIDFFKKFDKIIGLKYFNIMHLNDSCSELNSTIDRHSGLGMGYIFNKKLGGSMDALKTIIHIVIQLKVPIILETKVKSCKETNYKREIKLIKKYAMTKPSKKIIGGGSKNIKNKIIVDFRKLSEFHKSLSKKDKNMQSVYRARQYNKAIKSLIDFNGIITKGSNAKNLDGIGKSMMEKIDEIAKNGEIKLLKNVEHDPDIKIKKNLQTVLGIGPEISEKFFKKGIKSIEELKENEKKGIIKLTKMQKIGLKYYKDLQKKYPELKYQILKI